MSSEITPIPDRDLIFKTNNHVDQQLERTSSAIRLATGVTPELFWLPYGADDPLTFRESQRLGYVAIKWSVSSRDWERPGAAKIIKNVFGRREKRVNYFDARRKRPPRRKIAQTGGASVYYPGT